MRTNIAYARTKFTSIERTMNRSGNSSNNRNERLNLCNHLGARRIYGNGVNLRLKNAYVRTEGVWLTVGYRMHVAGTCTVWSICKPVRQIEEEPQ